jgi:hypothetical protein
MAYGKIMAKKGGARAAQAQGLPDSAVRGAATGAGESYDDYLALLDYEAKQRQQQAASQALGQMAMLYMVNRQQRQPGQGVLPAGGGAMPQAGAPGGDPGMASVGQPAARPRFDEASELNLLFGTQPEGPRRPPPLPLSGSRPGMGRMETGPARPGQGGGLQRLPGTMPQQGQGMTYYSPILERLAAMQQMQQRPIGQVEPGE